MRHAQTNGYRVGCVLLLRVGVAHGQMRRSGVPAHSRAFFGGSKYASAVEVPEPGADYYAIKDVPHGQLREVWDASKPTGGCRHARPAPLRAPAVPLVTVSASPVRGTNVPPSSSGR